MMYIVKCIMYLNFIAINKKKDLYTKRDKK